jgi:hypothetical protein
MSKLVINTNYPIFNSAIYPASKRGIELNIIKTNSIYRLAQEFSPNIVLCDVPPNDREFPNVKFVGPKCDFPNYNYEFRYGFDSEILEQTPPSDMPIDVIFINKNGQKDKLLIKKAESLGLNLKVVGQGYGVSQLNLERLDDIEITSLYKKARICLASDPEEAYKILWMNKICLTSFNFPDCHNIMKVSTLPHLTEPNAYDRISKNRWIEIFNEIMEITGTEIRW